MSPAGPRPRLWLATALALTTALAGCTSTTSRRAAHPVPPSTATVSTLPPEPAARPDPAVAFPTTAPSQTTAPVVTTSPAAAERPIGMTVLPLVDRSRPTVSHGRQLSAQRALTTVVWYPQTTNGTRPLVVFAHGYRLGVGPYRRACRALAQRGFVVAAPSFPLTDQGAAGAALDEGDTVHQPADLSFVITQILAASAAGNGPLSGRVDGHAIAAVGHSDGADTVLALGYLPGSRDARVAAVVADAPDPLPIPAGPPLTSTVPLLLVHGDRDTISPFAGSQRLRTQLLTPGWFLVLRGADHLPPIEGGSAWTPVFDRVSADFLAAALRGDANIGQRLTTDVQQAPATLIALP